MAGRVRYLHVNNGTFRFQRRVPRELQRVVGRAVIIEQLKGVQDRREAEREVTRLSAQWNVEFEKARALLHNQQRIKSLLGHVLGADVKEDFDGKPIDLTRHLDKDRSMQSDLVNLDDLRALRTKLLAARDHARKLSVMADAQWLAEFGDNPQDDGTLGDMKRAIESGFNTDIADLNKLIGDTEVPAPAKTALDDVVARWIKSNKPKPQTITEFKLIVRRFEEIVGDLPITSIKRAHVQQFLDALLNWKERTGKPLATASIVKHLGAIKALLEVAMAQGLIEINPASAVKLPRGARKKAGERKREVFSRDAIHMLTEAAIALTRSKEPLDQKRGWFVLLLTYTGARRGEVAALRKGDIEKRDGAYCVFFGRSSELKTDPSRRWVPLHQRLLDSGILEFVKAETDDTALLFAYEGAQNPGKQIGKWFQRWAQALGVKQGATQVLHSLRHTMKDAMREAGFDKEMRDRLLGHGASDVAALYGEGFSPKAAKQKIDLVYADITSPLSKPMEKRNVTTASVTA